jgi:hypothetical protein
MEPIVDLQALEELYLLETAVSDVSTIVKAKGEGKLTRLRRLWGTKAPASQLSELEDLGVRTKPDDR